MDKDRQEKIQQIVASGHLEYVQRGNSQLVRIGYCSKCGHCCVGKDYFIIPPEIYQEKSVDFVLIVEKDNQKTVYLKDNPRGYCRYYLEECMLYHTYLPELCKLYPRSHNKVLGKCTYLFINQEEFKYFKHLVSDIKQERLVSRH